MRSSGAGTTWWRLAAYLTGGVGSRHRDESFGDPYELPPDQAYAESCAAIASVMLAWRLLLATGEPACADVIERTVLNGVLPAIDLAGTSFFYVNPLQRRTVRVAADPGTGERRPWYPCACCPPNIMRTLSSWEQLVATTDGTGVQIQQYVDGTVSAQVGGGEVRLRMSTDQPWDGRVGIEVEASPAEPWTLSLRRPGWTDGVELTWPADSAGPGEEARGEAARTATWRAGDRVELDMPMTPRITRPHPRIDAVRGAVAIERGPLVYCLETADLPAEAVLEDIRLALEQAPTSEPRSDLRIDSSESSRTGRSAVRGRRRRWRSGRSRISHGPTAGRMGCGYGSRPPTRRTPEPSRGRSAGAQSIAGRSATAR